MRTTIMLAAMLIGVAIGVPQEKFHGFILMFLGALIWAIIWDVWIDEWRKRK